MEHVFFLHTCLSLSASLGLTWDLFLWIHAMKAVTQWGKTRQSQAHTWGPSRAVCQRKMGPQSPGCETTSVPHCEEPSICPKCCIFLQLYHEKVFFSLEKETSKWRSTFIQISIPVFLQKICSWRSIFKSVQFIPAFKSRSEIHHILYLKPL